MVILFISTLPSDSWGGSEEFWYSAAKQALSEGNKVIVYFPYKNRIHKKLEEIESIGAKLIILKTEEVKNKFIKGYNKIKRIRDGYPDVPHHYYRLYKEIENNKPDFICINQIGAFSVLYHKEVIWVLEELKLPYYMISLCNFEHYTYNYSEIERIRKVVGKAKKMFFNSQRNMEVAKRQLAYSEFNRYEVIKNPCKNICEKPLKMPEGEIINFANIARMQCDHKGQDILFEILSLPKWKEREWVLNLYGDGVDKEYLVDLANYYGINERINFKGYEEDFSKIWKENHILVFPSLVEGTPLTLIETMMNGRTAVVSDVGDNAVLIEDNERGFVASAPTVKLFDEALERAWQNRDKWEIMGGKAFEFINKSIDNNIGKTLLTKMINYL